MAIATGTAIALGVGAAASAYGAHKASQASKAATKAQAAGTSEALNFEREKEAQRRKEYEDTLALQKAQWDAWQGNRRALLRRYGVNIPEPMSSGAPRGATLRDLAGVPAARGPEGATPPMMGAPEGLPPRRTLRDIENWNDWSQYAPIR